MTAIAKETSPNKVLAKGPSTYDEKPDEADIIMASGLRPRIDRPDI
jgi:hypothetical protein